MGQRILKSIFKEKLQNNIFKKGKKQAVEKPLTRSIKQTKREKKKNFTKLIKLSIFNMTPAFKTIKLKNKRRRKKSLKEVPVFLSDHRYRTARGIQNFVRILTSKTEKEPLYLKLTSELTSITKLESQTITLKNEHQSKAQKEKKYFKHYRW